MPIPVAEIERPQMTFDQKIWGFLAQSPGMAFTLQEIMEGLGADVPYLTTRARSGGQFLIGLLVDASLEQIRDDARSAYARALLFLASQGNVQMYDYLGIPRFTAVARALPPG